MEVCENNLYNCFNLCFFLLILLCIGDLWSGIIGVLGVLEKYIVLFLFDCFFVLCVFSLIGYFL